MDSRSPYFLSKYHGYGNDFLIVPADQLASASYEAFARSVCDAHFGVGADGCIFLEQVPPAGGRIRIFNRDGSEAEMSGNGARCAAAYLDHRRLAAGPEIALETVAGRKLYCLLQKEFPDWRFRSSMGKPSFEPADIPYVGPRGEGTDSHTVIEVEHQPVRVLPLSVGNPQCVVFGDELPAEGDFLRLGAGLSRHPCFPRGTNVSFVKLESRERIEVRIWERGVGPTYSSGTGSCGAAVAAIQSGRAASPVVVRTQTGTQLVEWVPGEEIFLTGDARFVADIHYLWA